MARGMTLGQAAGGRPRRVQAPGASRPTAGQRPAPQPPGWAPRLGLGLGLGPQQRYGLLQQAQGQNPGFLNAHPGLQNTINQRIAGGDQRLSNFFNSGGQFQQPGRGQARGAPGSDVMPQPPPAQQRPPMMMGQPQPPQSMGMVGGNMAGQMPWHQMGVNPGMQSVLQNRAQGFGPPPNPQQMAQYQQQQMGGFGGGLMAGSPQIGGPRGNMYGQMGGMGGSGLYGGAVNMSYAGNQPNYNPGNQNLSPYGMGGSGRYGGANLQGGTFGNGQPGTFFGGNPNYSNTNYNPNWMNPQQSPAEQQLYQRQQNWMQQNPGSTIMPQ